MKRARIIHVAEVALSEETGMGRVAVHWRGACEARGHEFIHIGPAEVGGVAHPAFFPRAARRAALALGGAPDLFLVHEPASGAFVGCGVRTVVFSHGLERRGWELQRAGHADWSDRPGLKTRLLFPLWRLRPAERGLRAADAALLINSEDASFAASRYGLSGARNFVFRNGVKRMEEAGESLSGARFTVLFLGTWIPRKGTQTLARAAEELHRSGVEVAWILAGTGRSASEVLADWPEELHGATTVLPHFAAAEEAELLRQAHVLVLPSFFEGQPLALLQAMEAGLCCITTDCCGQRDLIRHGENGLLHAPGDFSALTRLLGECARDENRRRELGQAARLSVAARTWESVSADVALQLDAVMEGGRFTR